MMTNMNRMSLFPWYRSHIRVSLPAVQTRLKKENLNSRYIIECIEKENGILLLTASHSFASSPGGSLTASLRFPLPKVASMCFLNCAPCIEEKKQKKNLKKKGG